MVKEFLMKKLLISLGVFACVTVNAQTASDSVVMMVAGKQVPLSEFILRLYTTNPTEFIECRFKDGDLTGIIEEDRIDKAVINSSDLDKLQSGLIYYSYSFKSPNAMFNDAYYDEVVKGQTNYYLK